MCTAVLPVSGVQPPQGPATHQSTAALTGWESNAACIPACCWERAPSERSRVWSAQGTAHKGCFCLAQYHSVAFTDEAKLFDGRSSVTNTLTTDLPHTQLNHFLAESSFPSRVIEHS